MKNKVMKTKAKKDTPFKWEECKHHLKLLERVADVDAGINIVVTHDDKVYSHDTNNICDKWRRSTKWFEMFVLAYLHDHRGDLNQTYFEMIEEEKQGQWVPKKI